MEERRLGGGTDCARRAVRAAADHRDRRLRRRDEGAVLEEPVRRRRRRRLLPRMPAGSDIPPRRRDGGPRWRCALPDTEDAVPAATLLSSIGTLAARHRSGRPWLLTQPAVRQVLALGPTAVAVFGETRLSPATLDVLLRIGSRAAWTPPRWR